ncbi:uncharacterized protein B0P05DRAFT_574544 [Gilbertella persicaria]|uniref:uncharacterized protein n=1 Tax=Gilbertella persicaria TaxID=101096 RepID=UPI00221F32A6|nr:uncharacterized protein B0P05DRAFT_574544 [Gilbertella persicaria]KAI8061831.1 hypothetical protein B0P05DRAFT_574544 [Gilbertella persicaria]
MEEPWKQPTRTSSLQKPPQYDRESFIDPASQPGYVARETFIEPNKSTALVVNTVAVHEDIHRLNGPTTYNLNSPVPNMDYFHQRQHKDHTHDPEIRTVNPPKFVKSNVQHIVNSPVQVKQSCYLDTPKPSVAVIEQVQHNGFSLQPVPPNKKVNPSPIMVSPSTSHTRLPKPPLTPLVIPPTPVRSSSSPQHQMMSAPSRTSSMQNGTYELIASTPGGLCTPGSSRSANSPHGGLSPYTPSTPSPAHGYPILPSPLGQPQETLDGYEHGMKKAVATAKKHASLLPETKAEQLVHQGIKFHEAGRLEEATEMFKQASHLNLPIAMFLYGVSLRHGWGCKKSEHLAFQYLQKAAEHAVEDLSHFSTAMKASAAKSELIMAIYELGVSFRHGWGCKKNKETAVYYFKVAADLNDPDAQNDLGHCYYHGHGVKKDLCMAAKYYRLADKQGHGIMGNSWIWKSKYDK